MLMLMWRDDSRKKALVAKIEEAIQAYEERFKRSPTIVLLPDGTEIPAVRGVTVRHANKGEVVVHRDCIFVGAEA